MGGTLDVGLAFKVTMGNQFLIFSSMLYQYRCIGYTDPTLALDCHQPGPSWSSRGAHPPDLPKQLT
jgi:hypothetical protein